MAAASKVKVNVKDFAAKFKSKREVYNFLSIDVGVYLPSYGKFYSLVIFNSFQINCRANNHLFLEGYHEGPKKK